MIGVSNKMHNSMQGKAVKSGSGLSRFTNCDGIRVSLPMAVSLTNWTIVTGFLLSLLFAILFNFRQTTATHCNVPNVLPSFSAVIATPPSSYVWRLAVTLCSTQRIAAVFGHYALFSSVVKPSMQYRGLCGLCAVLEMMENIALMGLTCVPSTEYYEAHELFFIMFQASSLLYMLSMSCLFKMAIGYGQGPTSEEIAIVRKEMCLFVTNLVAFLCALYFFFRHNWYCEAGVYSLFAGCEYIVVLTNIIFHKTVSSYFTDRELRLGCRINSKT